MVAKIVWVAKIPIESLSCFWPGKSEVGAQPGESEGLPREGET